MSTKTQRRWGRATTTNAIGSRNGVCQHPSYQGLAIDGPNCGRCGNPVNGPNQQTS